MPVSRASSRNWRSPAAKRLDALFDIERAINGKPAADRLVVRQELSASLMAEFHTWLTDQRARLSRNHDLAKACLYMLRRWNAFTRFLGDGRVCLSNNAAERALRCVPLGRKAWLFCGSGRPSGCLCDLDPRHPVPRQQFVEPCRRMFGNAGEDVGEPGLRVAKMLGTDAGPCDGDGKRKPEVWVVDEAA